MKIAYLLLVHHQPEQAAKLIISLQHGNVDFFIHVDANADENEFRKLLKSTDLKGKAHFINKRMYSAWGSYSIVAATLNLLREAFFQTTQVYDYFVLLSGQHFPIKSVNFIHSFLEENKNHDFIQYFELPSERLNEKQGGQFRINRYHYFRNNDHKEFPPFSKKPILNPLFNAIAKFYSSFIRKIPLGMKPYAGSQWWILRNETVNDLLTFLAQHKEVEFFFKNVWVPDELFFQTVILHIHKNKASIINNDYMYIKWETNEFKISRPAVLTEADFTPILESKALFARKFDTIVSAALVEKIMRIIMNN